MSVFKNIPVHTETRNHMKTPEIRLWACVDYLVVIVRRQLSLYILLLQFMIHTGGTNQMLWHFYPVSLRHSGSKVCMPPISQHQVVISLLSASLQWADEGVQPGSRVKPWTSWNFRFLTPSFYDNFFINKAVPPRTCTSCPYPESSLIAWPMNRWGRPTSEAW